MAAGISLTTIKSMADKLKKFNGGWAEGLAKKMGVDVQVVYRIKRGENENQAWRINFMLAAKTYLEELKDEQQQKLNALK